MTRSSTLRVAALAAAGSLALAGCTGGGDAAESGATPTPSQSPSPTPTSTVAVPEQVALTEVGSDLSFGDGATVIYEPNRKKGTVLELTVTEARRGSLKDFKAFILDEYTRTSTPYYVEVVVENVGEGNVGDTPVPLWGVDANNTLLPAASFTTSFSECSSKPLPEKFRAGDRVKRCLVYLAPEKGTMEAVSFRPNQEFDPITWTGEIATPAPKPKAEKGKKKSQ